MQKKLLDIVGDLKAMNKTKEKIESMQYEDRFELLKNIFEEYKVAFYNGTWGWEDITQYKDIGFIDENFISFLENNNFEYKCNNALNCGDGYLNHLIIMNYMYKAYQYGKKQNNKNILNEQEMLFIKKNN